jgi:Lon protease-like protein
MKHSKLYSQAVGRVKDKPQPDPQEEAARELLNKQRKIWQHNPETKRLLQFLQEEETNQTVNALSSALGGNNEGAARSLIKVNTLKNIIHYVTRE